MVYWYFPWEYEALGVSGGRLYLIRIYTLVASYEPIVMNILLGDHLFAVRVILDRKLR